MRLIGLLSWYDEKPETLITMIASLAEAGVDQLVALDGAYALYPDGEPASDPNQLAAILLTCRTLGMGCTVHVPSKVWEGNEPEKRTALFAHGWTVADEGDWFLVADADTVLTQVPDDLKDRLEQTDRQVAVVEVLDVLAQQIGQADWPERFEYAALFKAQPITVGPHHAQYWAADGQSLWVGNGERTPVPALDLTQEVLIEHRPNVRDADRDRRKLVYYRQRDESRVERGDCSKCGRPAVRLVATQWRWSEIGPVGDWAEACEACAKHMEKASARALRRMGIDPDSVTPENRQGRAPEAVAR